MKGISIIIVTWNGLHHLKKYLPSVVQSNYPDFEIIIADNASTDGTREWLRNEYPNVKIAALDDNYGYCGGNNKAVPFAEKEILLFLNNDVRVDKEWLYGIEKEFSDPGVAAAQPKIKADLKPESFEYAGAAGGYMDNYGYTFCRGRIFEELEMDEGQYNDSADIFWATGAALAIRKNLFIENGGFDEDFEFHMEEVDLCWRLQNQGYKIRYTPGSVVYHLGGGSLPMGSPRKVYYNFRNTLYMLVKNFSSRSMITHLIPRLGLDIIAAWKALLWGKPKEFRAVVRAHFHFFSALSDLLKKRKKLQAIRTIRHNPRSMLNLNIVWTYFIRRIRKFKNLPLQ